MSDEERGSVTEFYPSRAGTVGALLFFLVLTVLPLPVVLDSAEHPAMRLGGLVTVALFGFGVYGMLHELLRPQPTLVITDAGFTYRGFPHVGWHEVERLRLRVGRLRRGGHEERFAEVILRDPIEFRSRVVALGDVRKRRDPDRPLYILPERLPVPVAEAVEAMVAHYPPLVLADGDEAPMARTGDLSADLEMVEAALVGVLTDMLPPGWAFAVLWFVLVGEEGHAGIQVQLADESVRNVKLADETDEDMVLAEELLALLGRHKELSYDQMTGTWLSGRVATKVDADGVQFQLSRKEIPEWVPVPEPDQCRRELAAFPRAGDEIPQWMRERIA